MHLATRTASRSREIDGRFLCAARSILSRRRPGPSGPGGPAILRVTDHKTSKNRSERRSIIGGGQQLQPVIYSLAVEAATKCTVESARFSYCTTAGGFTEHTVSINETSRRAGIAAMEIIDRAIDLGHAAAGAGREGMPLLRLPDGLRSRPGVPREGQVEAADS